MSTAGRNAISDSKEYAKQIKSLGMFERVLVEEELEGGENNRYARVSGRGVIKVVGPDAKELLNGIVTNQMNQISCGGSGFQTAFLLGNGRVLADAFIYPENRGPSFPASSFYIEIDALMKPDLLRLLRMHKLRSRVDIFDDVDMAIYSVWGNGVSEYLFGKPQSPMSRNLPRGSLVFKTNQIMGADVWLKDTRCPDMGLLSLPSQFIETSFENYSLRRILLGVPEGVQDFVPRVSFPLELNLDYTGGDASVDRHSQFGIKSLDIVKKLPPSTPDTDASTLRPRVRGRPDGKLASHIYNFGLAVLKLDSVSQLESQTGLLPFRLVLDSEESGSHNPIYILPKLPSWWP
ncbi:putative transferase caf-17, mitochondrial [Smittium mucronatum]|uniref:Putative transferase caf-17, mitochondrial n=1 Tax=Smittium mucronatum TaxID=133383 RepID=A0A1R0GV71_9FUNG|nr:putative transferase caf-17, mitochondrial [Smittium mucronatum]